MKLIKGNDPAAEKRSARLNPRFDAFARRYLVEHCEIQNKPSTLRNSRSIVETILIPRFGAKAISEISHDDVLKLRNALRQKPYRANRTIALLRHLMNWAEELGARPRNSNPCPKGTMLPEKKRNRFLSDDELVRLAKVLNAEEKEWRGHLPHFAYKLSVVFAIRLLVLTGARLGEILSLKWEDVDVKQRLIWLKDSKTGPKPIFLSEQALAVLRSIPRKKDNLHVIVGQRTGAPLTNLEKPWRRIRKAAGLADVRLHDLRHTYASYGLVNGVGLSLIGALLGHKSAATTHLKADPLGFLFAIMEGKSLVSFTVRRPEEPASSAKRKRGRPLKQTATARMQIAEEDGGTLYAEFHSPSISDRERVAMFLARLATRRDLQLDPAANDDFAALCERRAAQLAAQSNEGSASV